MLPRIVGEEEARKLVCHNPEQIINGLDISEFEV